MPSASAARRRSHRDADNPLRAHDRLGAACGIEYAAQAMAAHGALLAAPTARRAPAIWRACAASSCMSRGWTTSPPTSTVEAERLSGDDNTILYGFRVSAAGRELLSGRAAVVLDADKLGNPT